MAAAQDGTEDSSTPSSPSPSALAEPTVKSDEPQASPSDDAPDSPDEPVGIGGEILYTIQDDGNSTNVLAPGAEDADLLAANDSAAPDKNLVAVAIVVLSIVIVATSVGVAYYFKSALKQQI